MRYETVSSSPVVPGPRPSNSSDDNVFVCVSTASVSISGSSPIGVRCTVGDGPGAELPAGFDSGFEHAAVNAIATINAAVLCMIAILAAGLEYCNRGVT